MIPDDDRPLIEPLRHAYGPTDAQRERVWSKLRAAAVASAPVAAAPSPARGGGIARSLKWIGLSGLGLVVLAGSVQIWSSKSDEANRDVVATGPVVAPPAAPAPEEAPPAAAPALPALPAIPSVDVSTLPSAAARSKPAAPAVVAAPVDTLAEETRLLSASARAAKAGDFDGALALLGEHESRFPRGQLADERDVQRISVLCSAGREADARRRASSFMKGRESSALTRRVEQSCAGR